MNFQIITDTASDLSFDYLEENNVTYLGMTVTVDGKDYYTAQKNAINPAWFLEQLNNNAQATTSQINVGQFHEFFLPYAKEGAPILYVGFSSGLSGTFQSAMQARQMVLEDYPNADIRLIDTLQAANGEGLLVAKAIELRDAGKSIDEVEEAIRGLIFNVHGYFTVDDLHHLAKGGRISKTAATIGGLANIKPIMDVDSQGKLRPIGKIRGRKKALKELVSKTIENLTTEQTIFINYSGDIEDTLKVKEMLLENALVRDVNINPLGPTITTHTGGGCVAVFFVASESRK
ncbi:MAG: DegV family protein [Streptococcaceae bacterium]|jgi:DegV family protein with EDD domain|nr:DegV family protein [Streptococcaceae bacterium]